MNYKYIVGADECGYGSLAGALVIGSVKASIDWTLDGLNDSKLLSKKKRNIMREKLLALVKQDEIQFVIAERSNIQIDSFLYRDNGELKLYALVEVNYRKTMGLVIQSLAEKYPAAEFVEWKIESVKNLKKNPLSEDWVKISPEGNHFHSFFRPQRYL